MLEYAEKYAHEHGVSRLEVHSSAGCVGYFKKHGYSSADHYTLYKILEQ
jgi:histone acetyltransferase (RNA polymerase elongator complex component)